MELVSAALVRRHSLTTSSIYYRGRLGCFSGTPQRDIDWPLSKRVSERVWWNRIARFQKIQATQGMLC